MRRSNLRPFRGRFVAGDTGLLAMTKMARQLNEDALIDLAEKITMNIARAFAEQAKSPAPK